MRLGEDRLLRRREDREALRLLRAQPVHLDHPDCIYRTRPDGSPLVTDEPDIFRTDECAERQLLNDVTANLASLIAQTSASRVFPPLALGSHRDHVVTRWATEAAVGAGDGVDVEYFEDVPYVLEALDEVTTVTHGMSSGVFPVTSAELDARIEAASRYGSQRDILWHDGQGLIPAIRRYANWLGNGGPAERYWYWPKPHEPGP